MTVKTHHPDYSAMVETWKKCRDVANGRKAVHLSGESYLPRLADQDINEYRKFLLRAPFYNATWRTVSGMVGMLFRKEPLYEKVEKLEPMLEDITMDGVPFLAFCQQLAEEAILMGRVGLLVDYPAFTGFEEGRVVTQADVENLGLRPAMKLYSAETIINWKTGRVNNRTLVTMVVLKEDAAIEGDNEYATKTEERYRVLDLKDGKYRQRVYKISDKGDEQIGKDSYPLLNGKPLTEIPFFFIGVDDVTPKVDEPPMIDLVDLNLDHYRMSADYENGCHMTAFPTPVITGYTPMDENKRLYIGSNYAWVISEPDAKAYFLEYEGKGMEAVVENLNRKEQQMAIIGARMLAEEKKVGETATTAAIHRTGEYSILASIAGILSLQLRRALDLFYAWAGSPVESAFSINKNFMPMPLDAQTVTALVSSWQQGAISFETLYENLQRGEIANEERDADDERALIDTSPSMGMMRSQAELLDMAEETLRTKGDDEKKAKDDE